MLVILDKSRLRIRRVNTANRARKIDRDNVKKKKKHFIRAIINDKLLVYVIVYNNKLLERFEIV